MRSSARACLFVFVCLACALPVQELSKACEALHAVTVEHLRRLEKRLPAGDGPRVRPPTSMVSSELVHTGPYLNDDVRLRNVRVKVHCRALSRPLRQTWAAVSSKLFKVRRKASDECACVCMCVPVHCC